MSLKGISWRRDVVTCQHSGTKLNISECNHTLFDDEKNYQYFLHKPSGLTFEDQLKFSSSGDGGEREKDGEMS